MTRLTRVSLLALLVACASAPTPEELANLDYGTCPGTHEATIRAYFQNKLLPPTMYEGEPVLWPPKRFYIKMSPLLGGELISGYLVLAAQQQTFGPDASQGLHLWGFVFRGDELVKRLDPAIIESISLESGVGPVPLDERDWDEGHSASQGGQSVAEYVLPGESVQGWSELVTVQAIRGLGLQVTPEKLYDATLAEAKKTCRDPSSRVIASSATELLFEEDMVHCAPLRDEYAIRKFIRAPNAMFMMHYAKSSPLSAEDKAKWTELVGRSHVLGDCGGSGDLR